MAPPAKPVDKQQSEAKPIPRDAPPSGYPDVLRAMIRHENDVTNHRTMWLLVFQGLITNAYVNAGRDGTAMLMLLPAVGIAGAFSAFVILYKSYQARGYLLFLGTEAKRGNLREEHLPLTGCPNKRIKGWCENGWICSWLRQRVDLLEPYLLLPGVLILAWLMIVLQRWGVLKLTGLLILSPVLVVVFLSAFCAVWVWAQRKNEQERL